MPTLTIQLPGLPPVEHLLREEAITVGRMKGNSISLDDSSVSLSHAKITRNGSDYHLKDLNSTNGTMLNGQSISEARLCDGDLLKFGEVIALFRSEADPSSASPIANVATMPTHPSARSVPALPSPVRATAPYSKPSSAPPNYRAPSPASPPATEISTRIGPAATTPRPRTKLVPIIASVLGAIAAITTIGVIVWIIYNDNTATPAAAPAPTFTPPRTTTSTSRPAKTTTLPKPPAPTAAPPAEPDQITPAQPGNQTLTDLVRALQSPDVDARRRAAETIKSFEASAKDALPALRVALKDADPDVRMWAALALINNQVYEKATIPILVQTLHHENPERRQDACISLALIPYEDAEKATVIRALQQTATSDDSTEVRKDAQNALKIITLNSTTGR